jgi:hypothetical protein
MSFTNKGNDTPLGYGRISQATLSYKKGMIENAYTVKRKVSFE